MGEDNACPRCHAELGPVEDKGVSFLGCAKCYGLFVSEPDLFTYVQATTSPKVFSSFLKLHEKMVAGVHPGSVRHCPVCGAVLARVTIGESPLVLLDRCEEHGVWLDRTELKKVIRASRAAAGQKVEGDEADEDDVGPMAQKGPKKA